MIATVCDSNVYISAIVFGGLPRNVVMLGEQEQIQLLVSPGLISEVERVLARKFDELLKQAKESPDTAPPKRDIDLD